MSRRLAGVGAPGGGHHRRRDLRGDASGQAIVLFALALTAVIAMAGLLLDGGIAWAARRAAQNAADTGALAAAQAASSGYTCDATGKSVANAAAAEVATANGFGTVTVNWPPQGSTNGLNGNCLYLEVVVARPLETSFSRIVGQNSWTVSARAVVQIATPNQARCNFCSLNDSDANHTLLVKLGSTLRVDGGIYVNSTNGGTGPDCEVDDWKVCGDGFDIFGTGGKIQATTIQVAGGWETHDNGQAVATRKADPACAAPDPLEYASSGYPPSNVCIHQPIIPDPLANVEEPVYSKYPTRSGSSSNPVAAKYTGNGTYTLEPGVYWGGLEVGGTATVVLNPGVYIMASGGLTVTGNGSLIGPNVMIYNGSTSGGVVDTGPGVSIVPGNTSKYDSKTVLSISRNPARTTDNVSLTATVTRVTGTGDPTGVVTFYDGQSIIPGCEAVAISNKKAICANRKYTAGTHQLSAIYTGSATFDGSGASGVLNVTQANGTAAGAILIDTSGQVELGPIAGGQYHGLTIFNDRGSTESITLYPRNGTQCASTAADGKPQGCIGGLSGTIYAAHDDATTYVRASGTANLQIISGRIYIDNGNQARFTFDAIGFAGAKLALVE